MSRCGRCDPHSQNGNPSKINPEKVACFSSPKNDRQLTSVSPATHYKSTRENPRSAARFDQRADLRSSNLASINRTITVKIIAVETPNISAPSADSSGPSSFHDGDIITSP